MEDTKKKIAAMTAVLQFLETEKAAEPVLPEGRVPPSAPEGFWTFSGRQSQMILRSMAQMRLLPGWKG
jgi:hypothetical protein